MRHLFPLLGLLLCTACSSSDDGKAVDAGAIDARFLSDAARVLCSAEMNPCDGLSYEKLCDPARGQCVECLDMADCAGNSSLGPSCETAAGTCQCSDDADCAERITGDHCHPGVRACGCINTDNCAEGFACKLEPYLGTGIRTCRPI